MKKKTNFGRRTSGIGKARLIRSKGFMEKLLSLKENESMMVYYRVGRERRGKMLLCKADYAEPDGFVTMSD